MPFSPRTFGFLSGLARHNNKLWFEAHRQDYEDHVRAPMRELIEEMDVRLARIAPEIIGHPRHSMFRINRDIRFSRDKSPYKTHAAAWFFHRDANKSVGSEAEGGGAGFYAHIEPGRSMVGAGIWMPPRGLLAKIRDAIAEKGASFEKIVKDRSFVKRYGGLDDEVVLKRMPRGFAEDHKAAKWLKYQSFTAGRVLSNAEAGSRKLERVLEKDFERLLPLVRWLNEALGLKAAKRR